MFLPARYRLLFGASVFTVLAVVLGGCEPRATSPISQRQLTAAQLIAERDQYLSRQKSEQERDAAEAQRRVRSAKAAAELALAKLAAQQQSSAAEIQAQLSEVTDQTMAAFEAAAAERTAAADQIRMGTDGALAEIERQNQLIANVFSVLKPLAGLVPGGSAASNGIEALLGLGFAGSTVAALVKGRRAKAAEAQAGAARSEVADLEAAARSMVNGLDVLRMKAPEIASAMKANKAEWFEALTDKAVELINAERIT